MGNARKWPVEFVDKTPVTKFGNALTELLQEFVDLGCEVTADESWSWFSIAHKHRTIELVRRGHLEKYRDACWEVILQSSFQRVYLGTFFGLPAYTCIVIVGKEDLGNVTRNWLAGVEIEQLLGTVTFWDKRNPRRPLQARTDECATDRE